LEFLTLPQQSLLRKQDRYSGGENFLADSKTPLNTCRDRRGLDGATDGSPAPTSAVSAAQRVDGMQGRVVLLVLLVTIWHGREMFGGHDGVRVDGFHNDGFDC
jgi:hypothetical protein